MIRTWYRGLQCNTLTLIVDEILKITVKKPVVGFFSCLNSLIPACANGINVFPVDHS